MPEASDKCHTQMSMRGMQFCMAVPPSDWMFGHWDDLRVLLSVLRTGTFSKAARQLGLEQSTVSRRIRNLEQVLGFPLFERGRRAPVPTDAAEQLRAAADRVEAELGRFTDVASQVHESGTNGRVTVALTEELAVHFVVPRVLPELRRTHPQISIKLLTSYDAADLVGHEADIALRFFQSSRGDLVGKRIATLPSAVLASRAYAKRARGKALEALDWIFVELPGLPTPEEAWLRELKPAHPALVCSSYQVQLAAVRAGLGVGLGPHVYTTLDPQVVALPSVVELPSLNLYLLTRRAIRKIRRVAVVMGALEQAFGALGG